MTFCEAGRCEAGMEKLFAVMEQPLWRMRLLRNMMLPNRLHFMVPLFCLFAVVFWVTVPIGGQYGCDCFCFLYIVVEIQLGVYACESCCGVLARGTAI